MQKNIRIVLTEVSSIFLQIKYNRDSIITLNIIVRADEAIYATLKKNLF